MNFSFLKKKLREYEQIKGGKCYQSRKFLNALITGGGGEPIKRMREKKQENTQQTSVVPTKRMRTNEERKKKFVPTLDFVQNSGNIDSTIESFGTCQDFVNQYSASKEKKPYRNWKKILQQRFQA